MKREMALVVVLAGVLISCNDLGPTVAPEPITPPLFGQLTIRRNDNSELVIERDPEIVHGGSEEFVLRDQITVDLGRERKLRLLHVFHGLERGDLVEMDTEIHADGRTLYVRSDHGLLGFDAWETWEPSDLEELRNIELYVSCRVVGLDAPGRLQANAHFGVRFVWK